MTHFMEIVLKGINNLTKLVVSQSSLRSQITIGEQPSVFFTPTTKKEAKIID